MKYLICTMLLCSINIEANAYTESVTVPNPAYPKYSDLKDVNIPNGSILNFAGKGFLGNIIRAGSSINLTPNPLGINHSAIAVNSDPYDLFSIISTSSKIDESSKKLMLNEIDEKYHSIVSLTDKSRINLPFVLESDGSLSETLKGMFPQMRIKSFESKIKEYDGNIYIRPLRDIYNISISNSNEFMRTYLGTGYEGIFTIFELPKSVTQKNKQAYLDRMFCSEAATFFYQRANLLGVNINPSNYAPEFLSSGAGSNDLLRGIVEKEVCLKLVFDVDNRGCCKI